MDKIIHLIFNNLPAILIVIPLYYLVHKRSLDVIKFMEKFIKYSKSKQEQNVNVPSEIKIHACERLILLVDRLTPSSIIDRMNNHQMTNMEFAASLKESIKTEFDHNTIQQLYVSNQTWTACVRVKDNMMGLINSSLSKCDINGDSLEISNIILQSEMVDNIGIDEAKLLIKTELK